MKESDKTSSILSLTKYNKVDGDVKILLLYLLLNNYDLSKVKAIEEVEHEQLFGLKLKKIYGVTSEFVDTQKIEQDLLAIKIPVICSPQSFEMYASAKIVHTYKPREATKKLYINDMGVIAPWMIITENCIVSSNRAVPLENAEEKGFMFFVDYVLKGTCTLGDWEMSYKNKEFCIYFSSVDNEKKVHKELLYHAQELDQTSTYKLVLYVIKKVVKEISEYSSDNFIEETWERNE